MADSLLVQSCTKKSTNKQINWGGYHCKICDNAYSMNTSSGILCKHLEKHSMPASRVLPFEFTRAHSLVLQILLTYRRGHALSGSFISSTFAHGGSPVPHQNQSVHPPCLNQIICLVLAPLAQQDRLIAAFFSCFLLTLDFLK